jgi:hypothetical protein
VVFTCLRTFSYIIEKCQSYFSLLALSLGVSMKMISKFDLEAIRPTCKTITEFAEKVGLSIPTLVRQLKMYNLPTSYRRRGSNFRISKDQLERMYLEEQKSMREIANMYNVSHQAVAQWMEVYDIKARDIHDPTVKKKYPKHRKSKKKTEAQNDTVINDMSENKPKKRKSSSKKTNQSESSDVKVRKPIGRPRKTYPTTTPDVN